MALDPSLEALYGDATRDTIEQFEATGSPVITETAFAKIRARVAGTALAAQVLGGRQTRRF
jgi:hypothetical protein